MWENLRMTNTKLPQPHEQRKIEKLLLKLAKMKSNSSKVAPITNGNSSLRIA
jgi:hypothetical protein